MTEKRLTLYKRSSKGKIVIWYMSIDLDTGAYTTSSGQKDGKIKETKPTFPEIKNAGKANETSTIEQGKLEVEAKYAKQLKAAYFRSEADVDRKRFFQPMLAHKFLERYEEAIDEPVLVQRKLNGTRCVEHEDLSICETSEGAFSRKGEQYFCVEHITAELKQVHAKYPNLVIDGELFKHGVPLNEIVKLVSVNRKAKDVTDEDRDRAKAIVEFHIYDVYDASQPNLTNIERLALIGNIFKSFKFRSIKQVETELVETFDRVIELLEIYIKEGYEGAIIRLVKGIYELKRSYQLLKLKKFYDAEYKVVKIEEGKGDWAGCAKRIICELPDGRTFASNIRGTREDLSELFLTKEENYGEMATVEYQELSPYGVPLIPYTELPFRFYEERKP
jgi:DNA ligase-1|tara:strand:+ start:4415 stop:5584 length:1170 start_codon:yes stop_codon:yes gene_type:complete